MTRSTALARSGVFVAAAVLALAGCGGGDPSAPLGVPRPVLSPNDIPAIAAAGGPQPYFLITSNGPSIDVYDGPNGAFVQTIEAAEVLNNPDQTPLTFLEKSEQGQWIEVYLPVRPNGSTGWVHRSDVTVTSTYYALEVYLDDHIVVLFDKGVEQVRYEAALGTTALPTPDGVFFIRELIQPSNPDGAYGPYLYELSGFPPTLLTFHGGEAVIGLHGTNEPQLLGTDVSHGCIRISNDAITELVEGYGLLLGTPVFVYVDEVTAVFARHEG